ncbi:FG-GAP-like repeat-containing protein [Jannaschia seohaensis]|uniref:Repeat domain-containing protein n=1 Tax=Jannaschia seohaensis TaxID=475081 RepID=A0A2Y9AXF9_9RHOB|nr:FG-GAP-like repeat-containing protein [Jannaschia seohaensis]PWJ18214.1 VCBS repeat protein [Jannaschia seohaensis]SSA46739.1 Repeat domain-containing protein [Jannaschia seohaensis]
MGAVAPGAPRLAARTWLGLARGVGLATALVAGAAEACRQAPEAAAVPGSLIQAPGDDPAAIHSAWYEGLSDVYAHGVLGDALEPTRLHALSAESSAACGMAVEAGAGFVFEDIAPRLADVDGDGRPEVIAVRSRFDAGAQLIVYAARDGALIPLATTPHIGQRNRWLAPAAAADLDGDGAVEIAYVDRPHLARTLRVWRYGAGALREVGSLPGVTNHRIGEPVISGGLRVCGAGPEIVLASADWSRLLAVRFDGNRFATADLGPWSAAAAREALSCAR